MQLLTSPFNCLVKSSTPKLSLTNAALTSPVFPPPPSRDPLEFKKKLPPKEFDLIIWSDSPLVL